MKLIIQIPCFDEAEGLPLTLAALPRAVAGFDVLEYLVVDDGSTDGTGEIARQHGAQHVVRHPCNRGLAAAFMTGIANSLALGADAIVTIDGDNQYDGRDIPALIAPVRDGIADYALGVRPLRDRNFFPLWKYALTRLGTTVARLLSGVPTDDAPSGLRAYSAHVAKGLRVHGHYSYTMETLVLAGSQRWRMASVPIRVHRVTRPSRLMRSVPEYIRKSMLALLRGVALHRPRLAWTLLAVASLLPILALGICDAFGAVGIGWLRWAFGSGLGGFAVGVVAIWRVRNRAAHEFSAAGPDTSQHPLVSNTTVSKTIVGTDPLRGDDIGGSAGDQEKPLSDPHPVAAIGMPLATAVSEYGANG